MDYLDFTRWVRGIALRNETSIVIVVFLLTFMALVTYMPEELLNIGYSSTVGDLPEEFKGWELLPADYYIDLQITTGSVVIYDFTDALNSSFKVAVAWDHFYSPSGISIIWNKKPENLYFPSYEYFDPNPIDNVTLLTYWNSQGNTSFIEMDSSTKHIDAEFIDPNGTRMDIDTAYGEGTLNCSIYVPTNYDKGERVTARDIVTALLTFRLPSVLTATPPLFSFLITATIYVLMSFVFFAIIMQVFHGGG